MTTGTKPEVHAVARRWAAELLGVQENASSVEAKRAYLLKLRECDFLPPQSLRRALRILDGSLVPAKPDEEWFVEEEDRLRAEVASFAQEFFALPMTKRRERWAALLSRCQIVPPLMARLLALKPGLEVETQNLALDQSFRGQLAAHLLQSFPLPALDQATSRQACLRPIEVSSAAVSHKLWEKAARYLLAEWPALAALDKELVQHIAKLRSQLKRQSKAHRRSQWNRQASTASSEKGNLRWLILLVPILTAIMRGVPTSNNSSSGKAPSTSYSGPHDGMRLRELPPIDELLNPSKFDVEVVNSGGARTLRFTPRPHSTIPAWDGLQANKVQPLLMGEGMLRLMGLSPEQIDFLASRAAARAVLDSPPNPPREKTAPTPPKRSPPDAPRP
jgi:hypothetical protein